MCLHVTIHVMPNGTSQRHGHCHRTTDQVISRFIPPLISSKINNDKPQALREKYLFPSTIMTEQRKSVFSLVVFSGGNTDLALATDFVVISKKFKTDGLDPTCLSGRHLQNITNIFGPFIFGREDLRQRTQVYDNDEAFTPFYQLETRHLKRSVLAWIANVSREVGPGDRIIIVMIGHGERSGAIVMDTQYGPKETLTKAEMMVALSVLPRNVRLLFINEACYSGTWTTMTPDLGHQRDILVETASTINERSFSYTSGSGHRRCSMFGAAFVEEITTHSEGRISRHRTRIVDEMLLAAPGQHTSTPLAVPSIRALLSYNRSHFILTRKLATTITQIASSQKRHELLLQSRDSFRSFWGRIRGSGNPRQSPEAFGASSSASDKTETDLKDLVIECYLQDLGPKGAQLCYSGLASACQVVLEGGGPPHLKDELIAIISWQRSLMPRVHEFLEHLARQQLITDIVDVDTAKEALEDRWISHVLTIEEALHDHLHLLCEFPKEGDISFYMDDAEELISMVLAYNKLKHLEELDTQRIGKEIGVFFGLSQ